MLKLYLLFIDFSSANCKILPMLVFDFALSITHLHLLQARLVGAVAACVLMACLCVQEFYKKPARMRIRMSIWLIALLAALIFVHTLLQVQRTIK